MFEMLTGRMPFDGDGVEVAQANVHDPTPPMIDRAPDVTVDPLLEALTRTLLAKNPDERPAHARDVRATLELIRRDRVRAAQRLGVDMAPARSTNRPMTTPPPMCSEAPVVVRPMTMASAPLERSIERSIPRREQLLRRNRRRFRALIVGTSLLVAALSVGLAVRGSSRHVTTSLAATESSPAPVQITATEMTSPAPTTAPPVSSPIAPAPVRPPAVTRATHAPVGPTQIVARAPLAIARPAPQLMDEVPMVDRKHVLDTYAALGRELKVIADRRDMSADDLWQKYRRLRIQEMIGTGAQRAEAMTVLATIDSELARRFR
jgi:hypothetical protein